MRSDTTAQTARAPVLDDERVRDMFRQAKGATMDESGEPTDSEVEAIIAEFGGDPRAAIRALLNDLAVLAVDRALTVSRGYVRGRGPSTLDVNSSSNPDTNAGRKSGR